MQWNILHKLNYDNTLLKSENLNKIDVKILIGFKRVIFYVLKLNMSFSLKIKLLKRWLKRKNQLEKIWFLKNFLTKLTILIENIYTIIIYFNNDLLKKSLHVLKNKLLIINNVIKLNDFYWINLENNENNRTMLFDIKHFYKKILWNFYKTKLLKFEDDFEKKPYKKVLLPTSKKFCFDYFLKNLELTLSNYLRLNVELYFNVYNKLPFIINAKMICDYMIQETEDKRQGFKKLFINIKKWHRQMYYKRKNMQMKALLTGFSVKNELIRNKFQQIMKYRIWKQYPFMGLRIECSGVARKGRRKRKFFYGNFLRDHLLISKSCNNTFSADLDYYQSYVITRPSTIGIKVWVFYNTYIYNATGKFITTVDDK